MFKYFNFTYLCFIVPKIGLQLKVIAGVTFAYSNVCSSQFDSLVRSMVNVKTRSLKKEIKNQVLTKEENKEVFLENDK